MSSMPRNRLVLCALGQSECLSCPTFVRTATELRKIELLPRDLPAVRQLFSAEAEAL
jgi:hypothetical protein